MSLDRLIVKIAETQNPTVAGLDPKLAYVPEFIKQEAFAKHGANLKGAAKALLAFNKALIDALCDIVPAVKPQCAYYEMYGYQGVQNPCQNHGIRPEKGHVRDHRRQAQRHRHHHGGLRRRPSGRPSRWTARAVTPFLAATR